MKEFFGDRLVKGVLGILGLVATVGGPEPRVPPLLQPFSSNGCSVFPEGNTYGCCYRHDMAYWEGGTAADRRRADRGLQQCVADVSGNMVVGHAIGGVMYAAVSIFGTPGIPTRVQWGYGWHDTRRVSYDPLTPDEREQVDLRKQEACRTITLDPDTGRYMIDGAHWIRDVDVRQICPAAPASAGRR